MRRRLLLALAALLLTLAGLQGCATLDAKQREWIFQPSDRAWGGSAAQAEGMDDVWIAFTPPGGAQPVRLHGLWLDAPGGKPDAPVVLYLHGARWNVAGSAGRMRRLNAMGFAVLGIDYRGFGKSSPGLPSEQTAYEDARAAWDWLARTQPQRPRYLFGHSLGGAIAIDLASRISDERGVMVEGTFTSIADVVAGFRWGWLPLGPLITQRFDSVAKVARIGAPLLVVHGSADSLIPSDLGQRLYAAASGPKRFVLVEGASHHSALWVGESAYRQAITELFGL